jgi:hypothetical protein
MGSSFPQYRPKGVRAQAATRIAATDLIEAEVAAQRTHGCSYWVHGGSVTPGSTRRAPRARFTTQKEVSNTRRGRSRISQNRDRSASVYPGTSMTRGPSSEAPLAPTGRTRACGRVRRTAAAARPTQQQRLLKAQARRRNSQALLAENLAVAVWRPTYLESPLRKRVRGAAAPILDSRPQL